MPIAAPSRADRRRRPAWAVVAVALALTGPLAACGDDDGDTTTGASSAPTTAAPAGPGTTHGSSSPSSASGSGSTGGIDPMLDAGTEPVSGPAAVDGVALLTEVDAARHEGYDRVVWTFENGVPGYEVAYADPPFTEDGSGEPVEVDGAAFLRVRMEPASGADLSGAELRQTYTGPTTIDPVTPEITEVVRTGVFEAVTTWVVGVADPGVAFRVQTLTDPPRLVLDVQNH